MPNILFKLGTLDLSNFVRVHPDAHMDIAQGDMLEPAFSDSPLFEGQFLTSLHAKNKEMKIPLYLHPPTPPYTQDALNQLVQQVNQALRPVTDFGATLLAEWKNAQASNSTFYTVQFGRFEPDFNFRVTEKGWLAGVLHLWVLPYGHTGGERGAALLSSPSGQSGLQVLPASMLAPPASPSSIPNLAAWWKADSLLASLNDGDPIGSIADSSGNGIVATAAGSQCPVFKKGIVNNQPVMRITGSQWLGFNPPVATDCTVYVVHSVGSGYANWGGPLAFSPNAGPGFILTGNSNSQYAPEIVGFMNGAEVGGGMDVAWVAGLASAPIPFHVDEFKFSRTNASLAAVNIFIDQASQAVATGALGFSRLSPGALGQAYAAGQPGFKGDIAEVLVYNRALSDPERQTVEGYLWAKYGLGGQFGAAAGTVVGDLSPQFDLRVTTGSYTGDDGQIGLIAALPQPSYTPIIPVGSFFSLTPSAVIQGASGAWASQYLAMDKAAGVGTYSSLAQFKFAVSPGSVYATDDNRVLGLVRARSQPFGLRAFDSVGNPLGPTVVASAMDGWQLVDYGTLRVPAWQPTPIVTVQAFSGIGVGASGQFAPPRAGPGWTKEHGPVFVVPNSFSILDLDWNSPVLSVDGFDGASGVDPQSSYQLKQDQLGNSWVAFVTNAAGTQANGAIGQYTGQGGFVPTNAFALPSTMFIAVAGGSPIAGDVEQEAIFTFPTASAVDGGLMQGAQIGTYFPALVYTGIGGTWIAKVHAGIPGFLAINGGGSVAIPSFLAGQYHLRTVSRGSLLSAYLSGPSGAFPAAASGAPLIATGIVPSIMVLVPPGVYQTPQPGFMVGFGASAATVVAEAFRARSLASTGHTARDMLHLYQPLAQNTRAQSATGPDQVDLTARQRGPVQAPILPVPSLGAGLFVASFPWDQGPANDVLNVDVRIRERFTYAR